MYVWPVYSGVDGVGYHARLMVGEGHAVRTAAGWLKARGGTARAGKARGCARRPEGKPVDGGFPAGKDRPQAGRSCLSGA